MDNFFIYNILVNCAAITLASYVLYQQIKRLKIKDGLKYLRIFLAIGTSFIILTSVIGILINYCNIGEQCQQFDNLFLLAAFANSGVRVVAAGMLAIIYFKDGQCIAGKK